MTEPASGGGWDVDDFIADYRPPQQPVSITTRGDLLGELARLEEQLKAAGDTSAASDDLSEGGEAVDVAERILDVRDQVRKSEREFLIRSVGEEAWSDLIAEHPPTKEDREQRMPWHPATFWPAAIAASCVQPALTVDQVGKLLTVLSSGQMRKLTDAVLYVNGGSDDIPKSAAGFVARRASKRSSTTAPR